MSQKATRKSAASEEKEKKLEEPVKEMKKKMAANAEKEKQAAEKTIDKPVDKNKPEEKINKPAEKTNNPAEKTNKPAEKTNKPVEKTEKPAEKNVEKPSDKKAERNGENVAEKQDKKTDNKNAEKKDGQPENKEDSKEDNSGKPAKDQRSKDKPKQNGSQKPHNGVTDVTLNANGAPEDVLNGTVSEDDDDVILVIDDGEQDQDDLFPELTYDDTSDTEGFELPTPTPENGPSRSFTRRSQVKTTRTPETPRPASDKQPDRDTNPDDPTKDSKILKLNETPAPTDRKLRSADSPKPESKKNQEKTQDTPKKVQESAQKQDESPKKEDKALDAGKSQEEKGNGEDKVGVEIVIEVDTEDEPRKTDTNYSKSRVKVSPYRRSGRLADQTASSTAANYTGNNTTMEMDITETSLLSEEPSLDDSSYLSGLRSIRGRRSYKPLKEMALRHVAASRSARAAGSEQLGRPTGTVVGRKRKPEPGDAEPASEAGELGAAHTKRVRLLDRIAQPFRRTVASTPLPARRAAEIVGINTDLPLTAPVASPDTFDPETLKPAAGVPSIDVTPPTPTPVAADAERDPKRCIVM